ncbi:MAG: universal stress protein, partial [Anaerolineae bacterium]
MTKILVPLDGSSLAEQALSCALLLAQGLSAEVILLRAVWIPSDVWDSLEGSTVEIGTLVDRLEAEANDYLAQVGEQLAKVGLNVRHEVRRGPAAETILDYATQAHVDQIVMATHGYSGLKRWTHGSVAERVLLAAQVPLLLVRAGEQDEAIGTPKPLTCRRILVPLDGSPMAEQILPTVTMVARALGAELVLFEVPIAHVTGWTTGEWFLAVQGVIDTAEEDARAYLDSVAGRLEEQGIAATTAM